MFPISPASACVIYMLNAGGCLKRRSHSISNKNRIHPADEVISAVGLLATAAGVNRMTGHMKKNGVNYQHLPVCVSAGFRHSVNEIVFFWDITQRRLVIPYRRFRTNYRFHLQRSSRSSWTWICCLFIPCCSLLLAVTTTTQRLPQSTVLHKTLCLPSRVS
jgi:hypothetical protein